jgi:hypothetical protein
MSARSGVCCLSPAGLVPRWTTRTTLAPESLRMCHPCTGTRPTVGCAERQCRLGWRNSVAQCHHGFVFSSKRSFVCTFALLRLSFRCVFPTRPRPPLLFATRAILAQPRTRRTRGSRAGAGAGAARTRHTSSGPHRVTYQYPLGVRGHQQREGFAAAAPSAQRFWGARIGIQFGHSNAQIRIGFIAASDIFVG